MISVFGSSFGDEEMHHVKQTIASQWLGIGKQVAQFENKFKAYRGLENFLLVDSGSNALYMAIKLLELPPHSEIILPSFTWLACAQAVLLCGHRPVFADVDLGSQNITADHIAPHINAKTSAIMVVHYAGLPVDMAPILDLGLPVIEDAAHAVVSDIDGKACGNLGDVAIYSFDAVKNLAMGEGGGIATRHSHLIENANQLRYCGISKSGFQQAQNSSKSGKNRWWEYNINDSFIKMLPTDVEASIGLGQLEKLESMQQKRKQIWETYHERFAHLEQVTVPQSSPEGHTHSYFTYFIRVPKRDELAHFLLDQGIYTTLRYHPLHLNPIYGATHSLPNSEQLNLDGLNIPLHPNLSEKEVHYIADKIETFLSKN